jgi:hypothetical protein
MPPKTMVEQLYRVWFSTTQRIDFHQVDTLDRNDAKRCMCENMRIAPLHLSRRG